MMNFSLQVSYSHVATIEKQQITIKGSPLKIICKNFRVLNFVMYNERDCQDVYVSIQNLTKPGMLVYVNAFGIT